MDMGMGMGMDMGMDMVRWLQAGAGPNLPSHSRNTPLHVACAAGARLPLLRLLTHARAKVDARNCREEKPLHLLAMSAAFEAGPAVAHMLECGGRVGARDERGDTPLHKAVTGGQLERACQLVSAGGSLVTPRHAATPLRAGACNPTTP
jgi:ankyrin repeat protein